MGPHDSLIEPSAFWRVCTVARLRCPICNSVVPSDSRSLPFCSSRCRTIDLGRWLNEEYSFSDAPDDEDEEEFTYRGDDDEE